VSVCVVEWGVLGVGVVDEICCGGGVGWVGEGGSEWGGEGGGRGGGGGGGGGGGVGAGPNVEGTLGVGGNPSHASLKILTFKM